MYLANQTVMRKLKTCVRWLALMTGVMFASASPAAVDASLAQRLGLAELADTFDEAKVTRCAALPPKNGDWRARRVQAMLNCLGLKGSDEEILAQWSNHPVFSRLSDLGDPALSLIAPT